MKKNFFISSVLLLMATVLLFSCKKERSTTIPSIPPAGDPAAPVLLKDIVIPNLPSPYYHFEYDAEGKVNFASFASDLTRYNIIYDGGNIRELRNNILVNQDTLRYVYDNMGRVIAVNYLDITGRVFTKNFLTYDGQKLVKLERHRVLGNAFVINKIMTFSYYADGNLMEIIDHRPAVIGQQTATTSRDRFEQYDSKINVDGFSLIHNDFFDHLVFLPGVQFQKNNPQKEIVSGDAWNYVVNYTYTYNNRNHPLNKKGDMTITSGPDVGRKFQTDSFYSYYNE